LAQSHGQLTNEREAHKLARSELQRERTTKSELERKMQPLESAVAQLGKQHSDAERSQQRAQAELREQVTAMGRDFNDASKGVQEEARRLNRALSRSEKRGTWGEMQLHRLVESAGMLNHVHYVEQDHTATDSGTRRPDMVVDLAGGRRIVVDSKVSLDAFLNLDSADGEAEALQAHADAVSKHVRELSSKAYWKLYDSPEFVVMFLPAEGLLSAALEAKPALLQSAFDANVVLATPTTLLAVLRTISYAWQQAEVASQAKQIHQEGLELHKRLKTMAGHFAVLGGSLGKTVDSFNKTVSSMEARVLPAARRFESLIAVSDRIDETGKVDSDPQDIALNRWQVDIAAVGDAIPHDQDLDPQEHSAELPSAQLRQSGPRSA
jgi:DNA recombination protein RmuC